MGRIGAGENVPVGYVGTPEAAEILGVSAQTIRNRVKAGTLEGKIALEDDGRHYYYAVREAVEREAAERAKGPQPQLGILEKLSTRLEKVSERQERFERRIERLITDLERQNQLEAKRPDGEAAESVQDELDAGTQPHLQVEEEFPQVQLDAASEGTELSYERADDPGFVELVGRDLRDQSTAEERAYLRSPEGAPLWREALRVIRSDLETQNIARKADAEAFRTACMRKGPEGKQEWFEYKASWDAWKTSAARFKRGVETHLAEAKRLMQGYVEDSDRQRFRELLTESLHFLNQDEAITYKYLPARDALREKVSRALYQGK